MVLHNSDDLTVWSDESTANEIHFTIGTETDMMSVDSKAIADPNDFFTITQSLFEAECYSKLRYELIWLPDDGTADISNSLVLETSAGTHTLKLDYTVTVAR